MHTIGNSGYIIYEYKRNSLAITSVVIRDSLNQISKGFSLDGDNQPFARDLRNVLLSLKTQGPKNMFIPAALYRCMPGIHLYLYQVKGDPIVENYTPNIPISENIISSLY